MYKEKGVGLLEVMLVLAISVALIFASLLQYRHQRWAANIGVLRNSEAMLQQATIQYWLYHCDGITAGTIPFQAVMAMLPQSEWQTIQNPWVAGGVQFFEITLLAKDESIGKKAWVFNISTTIKGTPNTVAVIAANVGATAKGQEITWEFTPDQYPSKTDVHLGVIGSAYGYFTTGLENIEKPTYKGCSLWVSK